MSKVIKEMAVVVSTYEDRNSGQQKNRYRNIGVLMETESNGDRYQYLLLDKTFNPAGVPTKQGSDKVLVSLFDPRDRSDSGHSGGGSSGDGYGAGGSPMDDDEIPFAPEWRT